MKTKYILFAFMAFLAACFMEMLHPSKEINAATITRGITFASTDLVTNTKLHQLVDNATISAIGTADISDSSISNIKIAANAVTTDKVLDGTLLGTDIADRTLTSTLYATNSIDGIGINTNITTRAGNWDLTLTRFTANSITNVAVLGVTTGGAASDSGKIPKLNASGKVDTTMSSPLAMFLVQEVQASGVSGGTFTSGAWRTRVLNTKSYDTGSNCTLSANQITLLAGTYHCLIRCPAMTVINHQARLYNITDSATTLVGSSANSISSGFSDSIIMGRFTIAASKTFEIQHQCNSTRATDGFGLACSFGETEIYTSATFWKE